ncbi:putative serine esterase-domain-containing protein [Xylaria bambusicola]|uniref:putative serine esterase-domain-containing protein n=1 Tax=Xylaria bambusicola TaxID=326684 RepID=UPI002008A35C|nr:putative serine esterase-domain-containing protein [Xylaria bambusicola]KAI0523633.1 putative serine esterase-domain-containing protein [Xylaria bambusicola]
MLLLHQVGSVKIGEVVRYTVSYTPSRDRILPSPDVLHLRVRNTSPLPLRAAFVHGPYTLSVSAYPSHYDPNTKFENPRRYGIPEFEPMLKAAGTWSCQLTVPDNIHQHAGMGAARGDFANSTVEGGEDGSASWIVEISSQVIFSSSASVGFEILLARDEKSLSLGGTAVVKGQTHIQPPGKVSDFQQSPESKEARSPVQLKGVFSRAIDLKVDDTASLWNTPKLPGWDDCDHGKSKAPGNSTTVEGFSNSTVQEADSNKAQRPKNVHLVVLTHGLHSNLGADMLYLKESIDATARQAKVDAKIRKAREKASQTIDQNGCQSGPPVDDEDGIDDSDEEVIVRGFSGNATRTERGIKFLGKRLARYILSMTFPDQPFLPASKKAADQITSAKDHHSRQPALTHSTSTTSRHNQNERTFRITSISLIGHSLGGLVQTYAVAYIQKHSPQFFELIRPINFIALATPFLGLSNENPLYVKFALDFGLVGRTGQDVGLTWRAPTIARSGWGAIVGTLGENAHKRVMGESQPESKPLLRILPTGPAHVALKKFRNRTVYSNVVNDGIVPLRTSCLLFLDWQGLDRVEKARREAGLVETVVGFGWAELTGAGMSSRKGLWNPDAEETSSLVTPPSNPGTPHDNSHEVPQPASNATVDDDRRSLNLAPSRNMEVELGQTTTASSDSPFSGFFNLFKGHNQSKTQASNSSSSRSPKENKIYKRSQTLNFDDAASNSASSSRTKVSSGQELDDSQNNTTTAPPRTSFFESAGDLLNPKLPSVEFLLDPSKRPRTIFHDRIYHPSDIPPPPLKKRQTGTLMIHRRSTTRGSNLSPKSQSTLGSSSIEHHNAGVKHQDTTLSTHDYDDRLHTDPEREPDEVIDSSSMKVEEKIARAYHRDLSWRKVLVNLEPDAHNNIIVRRTFANAFGWPVVKHLVDAHFSDSAAARTRDNLESNAEQAKALDEGPDETGTETKEGGQQDTAKSRDNSSSRSQDSTQTVTGNKDPTSQSTTHRRSTSEAREATDTVPDLPTSQDSKSQTSHSYRGSPSRVPLETVDPGTWSDRDFADSEDESEFDMDMVYGRHANHKQQPEPSEDSEQDQSTSPVWNWTEKIVGKGATQKRKENAGQISAAPTSPKPNP